MKTLQYITQQCCCQQYTPHTPRSILFIFI